MSIEEANAKSMQEDEAWSTRQIELSAQHGCLQFETPDVDEHDFVLTISQALELLDLHEPDWDGASAAEIERWQQEQELVTSADTEDECVIIRGGRMWLARRPPDLLERTDTQVI
jgi:hypothetical protein